MSEATEYTEIPLQVCTSHSNKAEHWIPAVGQGELKLSAQELYGEGWCPNNNGTQWAICWGKLWGPSEQKWSHTVLQASLEPEQKTSLLPVVNFPEGHSFPSPTWILSKSHSCQQDPHLSSHWPPAQGRWEVGTQQEKIYWDPATTHRGHSVAALHQGTAPPILPEVGYNLDKTLDLLDNYSL
jgi:hypothetical protein